MVLVHSILGIGFETIKERRMARGSINLLRGGLLGGNDRGAEVSQKGGMPTPRHNKILLSDKGIRF